MDRDKLLVNIENFPASANLTEWSKALGVTYVTLLKYRRLGKLNGTRELSGKITISKETVLECFGLKPAAKAKK